MLQFLNKLAIFSKKNTLLYHKYKNTRNRVNNAISQLHRICIVNICNNFPKMTKVFAKNADKHVKVGLYCYEYEERSYNL